MQICFYFPSLKNEHNKAIFGSMYDSFLEAIRELGINAQLTTELEEITGDILVTQIGSEYEKTAAKAMRRFKGPVILNTYNAYITFNKPFLKRWKKRILFAYNTDFASLNYLKYNSLGIPFCHLAFGSDSRIFKPIATEKKYDIAFLGNGHSGFGREKYIQQLVDLAQKQSLNLFLAGAGWEKYGFPFKIVAHGEETNLIYNQSKVCINIHNDRQFAGIDIEMDANNRLFDLAMAGCCQVSNGEQMINRYFRADEVAAADNPEKWIKLVRHYLENDEERIQMGLKAHKRAIETHSWTQRATEFVDFVNQYVHEYTQRDQKVNCITHAGRYLDQYLKPTYRYKEIRIIRSTLILLGLYTRK